MVKKVANMLKQARKQFLEDQKEKIRYLKYKNTLPKNPMHDDIYIVEFPKSGITWFLHMLGKIELRLKNKDETITFYNHHKYMIDIHQTKNAAINRTLDRTFIKSHSEFNPYYYFVIYLIRNPFDVMVSYYNYMCNHGYQKEFEEFVKSPYGIQSWKKHVNSWFYKKNSDQKMHFIRYEDLLENTDNEIKVLYENFGVTIPEKVLEYGVDSSSIYNMKNSEAHYRKHNLNYTMTFVGKENKKSKDELLTDNIKRYIITIAEEEIKQFYPELIRTHYA